MTSGHRDDSEVVEVEVAWLWPDGDGGAEWPGGTARIPGAVPGDRVVARSVKRRGRVVVADVERWLQRSADRVEPGCPWWTACGGCDLAPLRADKRRDALAAAVAHTLRLGAPPPVVPSPGDTAHRARVRFTVRERQVGYQREGSHELVAVDRCAVARPELQPAHRALAGWLAALDPADAARVTHVELRSDGARAVVDLTVSGAPPPGIDELGDVAVNGRAVHGDPVLWLTVAGERLRASPGSFFQVNLEINELLVQFVAASVSAVGAERVLDLYAGIGNLSLPIARATGAPVVGVELPGAAIADMRASAERAGLPVAARGADVGRFDTSREPFDVVVLDPPRAGAPGVLRRIARQRPRRIVVVSCHAASAARDLRELDGYDVVDARCFDMFPDTHHIETVVVLDRGRQRVKRR